MGQVCTKEFTAVVADVEDLGFDSEPVQVSADYSRNKAQKKNKMQGRCECVTLSTEQSIMCSSMNSSSSYRGLHPLVFGGGLMSPGRGRKGRK